MPKRSSHTEPLQEKLYEEMVGRIKETDLTVPFRMRGYYYYSRTEAGMQYRIDCRKHLDADAPRRDPADLNALAQDGGYTPCARRVQISDDGTMLAYTPTGPASAIHALRKGSRKRTTPPDTALKVTSLEWGSDGGTLYYTVEDEAKRSYRLYQRLHARRHYRRDLLFEEPTACSV